MAVTRRMTLEEFLELPEAEPALEYVGGEVVQKVSPMADHGRLALLLGMWFDMFCMPRKLALTFVETRTTFGTWSPVPDVSVYRWHRIPRDSRGRPERRLFIPPDIAVEIASPGQRQQGLLERCQWFADNGMEMALLVDPDDETITRCRAGEPPRVFRGDERVDLDSVLPEFELSPKALFDALVME